MKYNHALFLNPYIESSASTAMMLFPPTGLEYVATSAKGLVGKITLLDLRYEKDFSDTNKLLDFIRNEIDIICVGIGWDRQFKKICDLLNLMPDNIPLVVGGYHATEQVDELFKTCSKIDIIVRGEGEETIREIFKDAPFKDILGISYLSDGEVIHNKNRALPDLDIIDTPDRSLRRSKYCLKLNGVKVSRLTFDAVLSARGCPFNCKFCTFDLNPLGQKRNYSESSVESVIKELEGISANFILFSDDNFATNPRRAEEICDLIIKRKMKKRFIAQARIDIAKYPKLLEKMVKAGFKMLSLGIESPHDHILEQLDKGFDSNAIRKAFVVLKRYPIFYHGFFIYGNLGETEEEMLYIAEFSKEINIDSIAYSKLRVDKYSPLREMAKKTPGYHVTDRGELYSDKYSHPALKKIGKKIRYSFYTPYRFLKILSRCFFVVRIFTFSEIIAFLVVMPRVLKSVVAREMQKGRLWDTLKRFFIKNANK